MDTSSIALNQRTRNKRVLSAVAVVLLLSCGFLVAQRKGTGGDPIAVPKSSTTSLRVPSPVPAPVPATAPRVAASAVDSLGRSISVSCASCHANFKPNFALQSGEELKEFHQGLKFSHGKLTCLSCHHAENYNLLRLAGRQSLDFSQTQTLCGQCHSKQSNDYAHGAHGGMNGSWDVTKGARVRKQCIDCHDPHSPGFPAMARTFKSHDRFLEPKPREHQANSHD